MTDRGPVFATAADYDELVSALRDRAEELGLSYEAIDDRAGLQSGYTAKLLGPGMSRKLGPVSLGSLLGTLGLVIELIEIADKGVIRAKKKAMLNRLSIKAISRYIQPLAREYASRGGRASQAAWNKPTKRAAKKRTRRARKAARARWNQQQG